MRHIPRYRLKEHESRFQSVGTCHCSYPIYYCSLCDGEHCEMCGGCDSPETIDDDDGEDDTERRLLAFVTRMAIA